MGRAVKESLFTANLAVLFSVYMGYLFFILTPTFISLLGNIGTALLYAGFILAGISGFGWRFYPSATVFGLITVVVLSIVLVTGAVVFENFQNVLPVGSIGAEQGGQLNQIVNSGASAISLSEVVVIVAVAGLIIAALFTFMRYSSGRYIESA